MVLPTGDGTWTVGVHAQSLDFEMQMRAARSDTSGPANLVARLHSRPDLELFEVDGVADLVVGLAV